MGLKSLLYYYYAHNYGVLYHTLILVLLGQCDSERAIKCISMLIGSINGSNSLILCFNSFFAVELSGRQLLESCNTYRLITIHHAI